MTIAPFAFGVIACLAAQGLAAFFCIIVAAVVSAFKNAKNSETRPT